TDSAHLRGPAHRGGKIGGLPRTAAGAGAGVRAQAGPALCRQDPAGAYREAIREATDRRVPFSRRRVRRRGSARCGGPAHHRSGGNVMNLNPMNVAGIMSGTSADGIDVAVMRIAPRPRGADRPKLTLLAHQSFPYPAALRRAVLAAMNAASTSTAE